MLALRLGHRPALAGIFMALAVGLAACAATNTNTTSGNADTERTAQLSHGSIVSMRGVAMQNQNTASSTVGGSAGSFIGRNDIRGNILGAVGGVLVGGLVGNVGGGTVSTGQVFEFIIQEDNASAPISVVQTNEDNFHPGERVALSRGARTTVARAGI